MAPLLPCAGCVEGSSVRKQVVSLIGFVPASHFRYVQRGIVNVSAVNLVNLKVKQQPLQPLPVSLQRIPLGFKLFNVAGCVMQQAVWPRNFCVGVTSGPLPQPISDAYTFTHGL
jgi:hypothetical protein